MEMLGGVLVLGRIAAADMAAGQAQAQMDPGIAGLDAIFADMLGSLSNLDLAEVTTLSRHASLPRHRGQSDPNVPAWTPPGMCFQRNRAA